ncbi:hypothetical protein [Flectobacillus major]|uniref:hypothetical protein n=1 Tax=Flectobacillus major TaxID=103 RepID=UPI00047A9F29|nr:hypothetical protein [Flectobacillus major]
MTIETNAIKEISSKVLTFINDNISQVDIDKDYYTIISSDEWYNINTEKYTLVVGSLSEDLEFLKQIIEDNRTVSISDLDRLSAIFRAISQAINPI